MHSCFTPMAPLREQSLGGRADRLRGGSRGSQPAGHRFKNFISKTRNFFQSPAGGVIGKIFKGAVSMIPGVGPAIGAALPMIGKSLNAITSGIEGAIDARQNGGGMGEVMGNLADGAQSALSEARLDPRMAQMMERNPQAMSRMNRALSLASNMRSNQGPGYDPEVPEYIEQGGVTGPGNAFVNDPGNQQALAAQVIRQPATPQQGLRDMARLALQQVSRNPGMLSQIGQFVNSAQSFAPLMNFIAPQNNQLRGAELIPPPQGM